jgi:hypothetical protein
MNRCAFKVLLGLAVPALLATSVAAQTLRPFPATALRGELVVTQPPDVQLNGAPARLSPGSRIRGANNMLQMSASLAGQTLLVHYTREPAGLLHDVWILTPEEAARKPWPTTPEDAQRWLFNPAAQTWTRR